MMDRKGLPDQRLGGNMRATDTPPRHLPGGVRHVARPRWARLRTVRIRTTSRASRHRLLQLPPFAGPQSGFTLEVIEHPILYQ